MATHRVYGTVTKTSNPKPWLAAYDDGRLAGEGLYSGLSDAKKVIEQASGGRFLIWTRDDLQGVEHYTGTDPIAV